MTDWIALISTVLAVVGVLLIRFLYLHRVREGRADTAVDPSWPSTARPSTFELPEPPPSAETSLYHDPDEPRGERDT